MLFLLTFKRIVIKGQKLHPSPKSGLLCPVLAVTLAPQRCILTEERLCTYYRQGEAWTSKSLLFLLLALVCVCTVDVPLAVDRGTQRPGCVKLVCLALCYFNNIIQQCLCHCVRRFKCLSNAVY